MTPKPIIVRHCNGKDRFVVECILRLASVDRWLSGCKNLEFPDKLLAESRFWAAQDMDRPDRLVGLIVVRPEDSGIEIAAVYVGTAHRRRGYASAMVQEVVRNYAPGAIHAHIHADNLPARLLFGKHHFTRQDSEVGEPYDVWRVSADAYSG